MAVTKPSWLKSFLNKLNWDIFTWKVYVGDAIESAIDWVIDGLNWVTERVTEALNRIATWWTDLGDWWLTRVDIIKGLIKTVLETLTTWGTVLRDWWDTRVNLIKGWIGVAADFLKSLIDNVSKGLNKLTVLWDNFWTSTWPQFTKNFNDIWVKVGNFFTVTLPTLASNLNVVKAFNDFRLEWSTLLNFWGEYWKGVIEFFINPLDWLLDRFTDWFLGREK